MRFMKRSFTPLKWLIPCLVLGSIQSKAQQPFGAGNLVVYRVGDGSAALNSAATAVFIDEYSPSGTLVQSIPMPTVVSGSNHRLTASGSATSEGGINLSPNGKYLALGGYDAATGTASVVGTASATTNRVVGIVNSQGIVNTASAFTNVSTANNIRSAITTDSTNIWMGCAAGGVYYATAGTTTATSISGTLTNTRFVNIFNNQLYISTSSGSTYRIATIGTGLPTTASQTLTNLPGVPPGAGSPYGYYMATLSNGNSVLYIADDGSTSGGILKYSLVSGTWTANGVIGTPADAYRGITGMVRNDSVFLYVTSASKLLSMTDGGGYNTTATTTNTVVSTLVTASANEAFRGVAFAPQCAAPSITTAPTAQATCAGGNATFSVTATGSNLTYQWQKDGTNISGATANSYTITGAATTDAGNYAVVVSSCSSTTTTPVALTVNAIPAATVTATGSTTICTGNSVVLNASTGTGYTYQWQLAGVALTGATNATYTASTAGDYTVVVTSNTCTATSAATTVTVTPGPTATITAAGNTGLCPGGSVVLNANTGTGLSYQWANNGTNISGATTAAYTANAAGNYTVTVSNGTCSATSAATAVTILTATGATITPAGTTTFCTGGSVVLNANTGTGLTYQWSNGTNISGATNSSYTATSAGSYTVTVSNGTCSSTSPATTITVNAAPTATATAATATTFCQGGSVVINANTGTGLTYQWTNNGTNITGATTASYTANATGAYTVVVTNASTCSATATAVNVTVNALPTATNTAATDTTFCTGGSVVLNANTGTGLTYQWTNNSTNITGATAASYTANAAGVYAVVVTNASNCSATSNTKTVTVTTPPTATNTATTDTTFCAGGSVVLNANTGTGLTYQWMNNGTNITGATNAAYTANASGVYSVQVSNAGNCSANSNTKTVTVNPLPVASVAINGLTLNTGSFQTYQWYYNNQPISGATQQSLNITQNGTYFVQVADLNGCSNNSDTVNIQNVGVETVQAGNNAVKIYPNPANTLIHIDAATTVNVMIRDITGKVVFTDKNVKTADISNLTDGLYMIFVTDKNGQFIHSEKLMKVSR